MNSRLRSSLTAWPITMVLVASLYFLAARLGWSATTPGNVSSPVWPAAGLALGAMILLGYRIWPAIFMGELSASLLYFTSQGTPFSQTLLPALLSGVNCTLEIFASAWLICRLVKTPYPFERTKDLGLFAGVAALVAPSISATLGVLGACSIGIAPWENFLTAWLTWWAGDAVGALIITPFVLTWLQPSRQPISLHQWAKGTPLFALLASVIWLAMENTVGDTGLAPYYLGYLVIPITVAVTFQFGQRGATLATLITASIAVWRILEGHGSFSAHPQQALLLLQSYLAVLNITVLMLAAVLTEREQVKEAMRESAAQLELTVHAARMGTWNWNIPDDTIQWSDRKSVV